MICTPTKYYSGDIIEKNEMDRVCSAYGGRREVRAVFWWGNQRELNLEDSDVDGRTILKWIFLKGDGGIDWIDLTQGRDRWRAVINAAMDLWP
jgi:hypothetical protein